MRRRRFARKLTSIAIAAAMLMPALAPMADAAVATWLAPQPGEKLAKRSVEVSVGYNTQSDKRVTRLELWIDSRLYATKNLARPQTRGVCSFWWDTSRTGKGAHKLLVRIFAGDQLLATVSGNSMMGEATYDPRMPTVRFATIKSGDVLKGVTSIKLAVSDDGAEPPIVSLLVDNVLKFLTNRRPYVYGLDTTNYTDGDHELQTFAYDTAGNKSDPAVVKVAFKNGQERPVVASVVVDRNPAPVAPSEDDGVGKLLPPVEPRIRTTAAARSVDPESHAKPLAPPARPVAPVTKPTASAAKVMATAPTAPMRSQTPPAAQPKRITPVEPKIAAAKPAPKPAKAASVVAPSSSAPTVRPSSLQPSLKQPAKPSSESKRIAMAAEPATPKPAPAKLTQPRASSPGHVTAFAPPVEKAASVREKPVASKPAEPAVAPSRTAGRPSVPKPVTVAAAVPTARAVNPTVAPSMPAAAAPPASVEKPSATSPASLPAPDKRPEFRTARLIPDAVVAEPQVPACAAEPALAASPKPVRVAMLPAIRGWEHESAARSAVMCPPPAAKDTNAKIEKRLVPAKGKVKFRDLVNELGGVVFWDAETRTVTAYVGDLKIELSIGSPVVKANGRKIRTDQAAMLVRGRTIIDAGLYRQICAILEDKIAIEP